MELLLHLIIYVAPIETWKKKIDWTEKAKPHKIANCNQIKAKNM